MTLRPPRSVRRFRQGGGIQVEILFLLALLPLAGYLFVAAERRRRRGLRHLAGDHGVDPRWIRERRAEFFCLAWAAGLIILALARPTWREVWAEAAGEGRDVVFLLDVSRSMLAADVAPNRLEAAKTAIRDCVAALDGDRLALVVFSGSASILCPLTSDTAFFHDKLDEAHPDFLAPGEVRVGGTRIGDAIRKTTEKLFTAERRGSQDLILLSDGGDQESAPLAAVERLGHLGVYFIAIGLGDAARGARIPAPGPPGQWVREDGKDVWTRLEAQGLRDTARACRQGVYLDAGTRVLPLGRIYPELVRHLGRGDREDGERFRKGQETFPLFLGIALLLLAPPVRRLARDPKLPPAAAAVSALVLGLFPGLPEAAAAPDPARLFRDAVRQLDAKNHAGAALSFTEAAERFRDPARQAVALHNAGLACLRQGLADEELDPLAAADAYARAVAAFRASLDLRAGSFPDTLWNLELALAREAKVTAAIARQTPPPSDENEPAPEPEDAEPRDESQEAGDKAESSEEAEGESSAENAEGEATPTSRSQGDNALDLETQDLPPPMVEPEELLAQEVEQGELRQKNRATRYKSVEKDW
jgi:hypothetical protein